MTKTEYRSSQKARQNQTPAYEMCAMKKVLSINRNGSYNKEFYKLLSEKKITDITQRFDFEYNILVLEGLLKKGKNK